MNLDIINKFLFLWNTWIVKIKLNKKANICGIQRIRRKVNFKINNGYLELGAHVGFEEGGYVSLLDNSHVYIGNDVFFNRNCILVSRHEIEIGANCIFGPNVVIYDHDHKFNHKGYQNGYSAEKIIIGPHCWIGAGVTILKGTSIGEGCVIGAGTVVKGVIPAYSIVTAGRELSIVALEENHDKEKGSI